MPSREEVLKEKMPLWAKNPILFIDDMWNLVPQPVKPEFKIAVDILVEDCDFQPIKAEWFEPFQKGLHITWQQWLILLSVKAAIDGKKEKRISIASAHGIGKSCSISWLLIWYLFSHFEAQVACTAPTSKQLKDVLWKEIAKWISRMPEGWQEKFDWQSDYVRMVDNPETWFASARTSRKDSTEALAGVHGDHVMIIADEASGVEQEIFNTMEGSLTEKDILVLLISNPTRLNGYFYDSHHKMKHRWQTLQFDNLSSPVVKDDYAQGIIDQHGENSDEYKIRVLGKFPNEDSVDKSGYIALLNKSDVKEIEDDGSNIFYKPRLGIDPAGGGKDKTAWILRDNFRAKIVLEEAISNPKKIVDRTMGLIEKYNIPEENIDLDMFGTGAEVAKEFALQGYNVCTHNVGDKSDRKKDQERFLNKRACWFFRMRAWLRQGGELVRHKEWSAQALSLRYRRTTGSEKIQIMSKRDMKKDGYYSPDHFDALMLTFSKMENALPLQTITPSTILDNKREKAKVVSHSKNNSDKHSAI